MPTPGQFDPALGELLLRAPDTRRGDATTTPVVARLVDPLRSVPWLSVRARFGHVVTARVPLDRIVEVRRHENVASLKASAVVAPDLAVTVSEIRAAAPGGDRRTVGGATGRGVVVGVLDWGCDFAHENFRTSDGRSRIRWLWDQRGGASHESPEPYGYGRELAGPRIDAALATPDPYAALAYDPADADAYGSGAHGTHVMDIAAGNGSAAGSSPGVAPEADLVFVHLAGDDTDPRGTLGDSVRLLEAVHYVVDRAGDAPAVVNLSLGGHGGPHDGTTLVEQALDELLASRPGLAVVLSAGNYFDADVHASGRIAAGEHADLLWHVTPRNDEVAELELWYAETDRFEVELIDPTGRVLARVPLGENRVARAADRVLASLYHRRRDPNNGANLVDVFLWPDAPIGTWTVRCHGVEVRDGRYHAWIERDDPDAQSHFLPESASPMTTVGTICTGHRTIAVGAYDAQDPQHGLAPFSSSGRTRDGRQKPDLVAPGATVRAARSGGGVTVKSGTSMAAPHVTGTIALMFEAAGAYRLSIDETREIVLGTARPLTLDRDPDRLRSGAGRVDAEAAVCDARKLTHDYDSRRKTMSTRNDGGSSPAEDALRWLMGSLAEPDDERPAAEEATDAAAFAGAVRTLRSFLQEEVRRGRALDAPAEDVELAKLLAKVPDVAALGSLFKDKLTLYAADLKIDKDFLLAIMYFESGLNPAAINSKSNAAGLIQFIPSTAKSYGTSTRELLAMTAEAQLDYVWLHFKGIKKSIKTLEDAYMAVLYPSAVGKPDTTVLFTKDDPKTGDEYEANEGLDANKDGEITIREAVDKVIKKLKDAAALKGASASDVLKRGASGTKVEALQNLLIALGHLTKDQKATGPGLFGVRTEKAMKEFQSDNYLRVTGVFDIATQRATSALETGVTRGATGGLVKALQDRLVKVGCLAAADRATGHGTFGQFTEDALKRFQTSYNVTSPAGVFDVDTYWGLQVVAPLSEHAEVDTMLPESGTGFRTYGREGGTDQYGRRETIEALIRLGELWNDVHPDRPFQIGDISHSGGGDFPPHVSHRTGVDVDIRPFRKDGELAPVRVDQPKLYDAALTREFIEFVKLRYPSAVIALQNPTLLAAKLTVNWDGHMDHMHVRFKW